MYPCFYYPKIVNSTPILVLYRLDRYLAHDEQIGAKQENGRRFLTADFRRAYLTLQSDR